VVFYCLPFTFLALFSGIFYSRSPATDTILPFW